MPILNNKDGIKDKTVEWNGTCWLYKDNVACWRERIKIYSAWVQFLDLIFISSMIWGKAFNYMSFSIL